MGDHTQWVAVDWGTSNVRAWGISADGLTTFSAESDKGMSRLSPAQFSDALGDLLAGELSANDSGSTEIIVCGMAGARQGWLEAPYIDAPANLNTLLHGAVRPTDPSGRFSPSILPGVAQRSAGREDVMRGEETQLLGLLALQPGFSGVVVLPGTHSKWVLVDDGKLTRFSTALTGELFELLSAHSVLRHTVNGTQSGEEADEGFAAGVDIGIETPDQLMASLFRARAASLLSGRSAEWCRGYLSGLLIGSEIGAHRSWLSGVELPLIGSRKLAERYRTAFSRAGTPSRLIDATEATLAGLKQARMQRA
jgi:2-dehydro-3-deoxygalactonokinase